MTRRAVALPGRMFGHTQMGVLLTELALEEAGIDVVRVEWPVTFPTDRGEQPAEVRRIAAAQIDAAAPAYVVGKSRGTWAAPVAAERGLPAIWLTPLLRDDPACSDGILANPAPQLLVGGTADFAWDPAVAEQAAQSGCRVVELPGADHGFQVTGDAVATAETLVVLTSAVREFLRG